MPLTAPSPCWKTVLLGAGLAALAACGDDDDVTAPETLPARYVLPGATVFPEGITYDSAARALYVGSTTDGAIYRADVRDTLAAVYLPGGADQRTDVRGVKVDGRGRLFAAGGATGRAFVYDTRASGGARLVAALASTAAAGASFLNDVAVGPSGDAYFTDSREPVLYRVPATPGAGGQLQLERWLPLAGTPIVYGTGFNLNGIVATSDGRYLLTVQSNTGRLYRVTLADKAVREVAVTGATLTNGDGLVLEGQTLYVVRNANREVVKLTMSDDFAAGAAASVTTYPGLLFPTTAARAGARLLLVNSQLDRRTAGQPPALPFTVASVPLP